MPLTAQAAIDFFKNIPTYAEQGKDNISALSHFYSKGQQSYDNLTNTDAFKRMSYNWQQQAKDSVQGAFRGYPTRIAAEWAASEEPGFFGGLNFDWTHKPVGQQYLDHTLANPTEYRSWMTPYIEKGQQWWNKSEPYRQKFNNFMRPMNDALGQYAAPVYAGAGLLGAGALMGGGRGALTGLATAGAGYGGYQLGNHLAPSVVDWMQNNNWITGSDQSRNFATSAVRGIGAGIGGLLGYGFAKQSSEIRNLILPSLVSGAYVAGKENIPAGAGTFLGALSGSAAGNVIADHYLTDDSSLHVAGRYASAGLGGLGGGLLGRAIVKHLMQPKVMDKKQAERMLEQLMLQHQQQNQL